MDWKRKDLKRMNPKRQVTSIYSAGGLITQFSRLLPKILRRDIVLQLTDRQGMSIPTDYQESRLVAKVERAQQSMGGPNPPHTICLDVSLIATKTTAPIEVRTKSKTLPAK